VDHLSLDKWIENFEKDRNPESEIRVWETLRSPLTSSGSLYSKLKPPMPI
jgi:hypothetical protein